MSGAVKLSARDVSITYPLKSGEPFVAISGLTLDVREGEFVSIVGPSGCGKSTFLGVIAGFISLASGELRLDGRPIDGPGRERGVVFQQASLFPWRTALHNVLYGLELAGVPRAQREARGMQLLQLVGLENFRDHYPAQLSGGMQQRVNLARALAIEPTLMLLDEPFGALDAQTRELMQAELLRIWESTGQTTILVTHDIGEAVYLGDRVVVISAGPGRVCDEVTVDLPRPRSLEIKHTPEFLTYERRIWHDIMRETGGSQ